MSKITAPETATIRLPAKSGTQRRIWFRFFKFLADCLCWLEELKPRRPCLNVLVKALITTGLGLLITWVWFGHPLNFQWILSSGSSPSGATGLLVKFGLSVCCGFLLDIIIAQGLTPLGKYGRLAVEFNAIGLFRVATGDNAFSSTLRDLIAYHTEDKVIRIICISGQHLFQSEQMPNGQVTPLRSWAERRKIEALMPESSSENLTIKHRYETYDEKFREAFNYTDIGTLVTESDTGKKFLLARGNRVLEHNILCIWRVVLLSEHCIVQSYFPNASHNHSFLAPVFVFLKSETGKETYYDTFSSMFELIKKSSKEISIEQKIQRQ